MNTQAQFIRKNWLLLFTLLFIIISGGLGLNLLTAQNQKSSSVSSLTIDDFSNHKGNTSSLSWTKASGDDYKTTDGRFVQNPGRSYLNIKEPVCVHLPQTQIFHTHTLQYLFQLTLNSS